MKSNIILPETNLGSYMIPEDCERNCCVDIGANIGDFTFTYANQFQIFHFYEPYLPCFEIVSKRIKNFKNVVGFQEAVYNTDNEKLSLIAHSNYHAGSTALNTDVLNGDWVQPIDGDVNTVSLTTILDRVGGHINYLKVDCETSEYYFLNNQNLQSIDYIGIELHWHMGEVRYNELLDWIARTHTCIGDSSWTFDRNKEVLFKNKTI
jgi:FkbM family methyltransferase